MPSIALGQVIQGSFTNTDPKINNTDYYDEYDLPTNLATYNNISITFSPNKTGSAANTPGTTTLALINATTNAIVSSDSVSGSSANLALIDQAIAPGIKYKIRVSNSNLSSGNYSLSLQDQGAATSILSYGSFFANGTSGAQVGTVNSAGKYFPLVKTTYGPDDIALASNGLLYGVTPSFGTSTPDRIYVTNLATGNTFSSSIIKDTAGNNLRQSLNSLALANTDDKLYAIGTSATGAGSLYQIDTSSFVATSLGSLPTGLSNAGDLVYDAANNRFLAVTPDTGVSDALWSIPLANPSGATKIGQLGFKGITGLSLEGIELFGFVSNTSKYSINTTNGVGTLKQTISGVGSVTGASTLVYPGQVLLNDFKQDPAKYMRSILDYDGNNLGVASSWKLLGDVDIQGDGSLESILVNPAIGRFASVGAVNGNVDFSKHGLNGDTRVVGIYIDPTLKNSPQNIGGPFDSQRRFQNDLQKDNLRLLAASDYDKDGFQDLYFKLGDGSAVLRALMFKDGNIQYANYQSKTDLAAFMTANNVDSAVWGGWI
ncbi:hypothetical protein [Chamaesiphon sp.]|uniref:hypothetical protein n=1 Tax=Chamaesiphon sp. TaxID=2814140 RepID=UPI003593B796